MSLDAVPSFPEEPWHALDVDVVLKKFQTRAQGLSSVDAFERMRRYGSNVLQVAPPVAWWKILLAQLNGALTWLLSIAIVVAYASKEELNAIAIGAVLALNVALGFFTELRARRAMESLRRLDVLRARVMRDGGQSMIDARELVPGDVIVLAEGDAVPADARLLRASELRTNEATLTGESLPVDKRSAQISDADAPLAERWNMVFKGSLVVAGRASAVVVATGTRTQVGGIGALVSAVPQVKTHLERQLEGLARDLSVLAGVVAIVVGGIHLLQGGAVAYVIQTAIAVAVAAVPEGLPTAATAAMAIAVWRMARRHELIRRLPIVETLGAATLVCTDKTGTLTTGELMVTTVLVDGREWNVSGEGFAPCGVIAHNGQRTDMGSNEPLARAIRIGMLTSRADIVSRGDRWHAVGDPTDAALIVLGRKAGIDRTSLLAVEPEVREIPFSSDRMFSATIHRTREGPSTCYVKGAPDRVIERCDRILTSSGLTPFTAVEKERSLLDNAKYAKQGLRVLAVAYGDASCVDEKSANSLTFVGLVAMADLPTDGVSQTIAQLHAAGIRTVMLTGDQRWTAEAIGRQLGVLRPNDRVMEGREVDRVTDEELPSRIQNSGVFCRMSPEAKLRIITAYQRTGEIVAMLGDGINDAAALRRADIGVAMGLRGSDAAKEAADVILQDDRFQTVAAAVEEGRALLSNLLKFIFFALSGNLAEILVLLLTGVAGLPLPLSPLQILWINLVTDTFPALALAMDRSRENVMDRPPQSPHLPIFSRALLYRTAIWGAIISALSLGAFLWSLHDRPDDSVRASMLCFQVLVLAQLTNLANAGGLSTAALRDLVRSPYTLGAVIIVVGLQIAASHLQPLAAVLHLRPLTDQDWLIVVGLAVMPAVFGQSVAGIKAARRRAVSAAR